MLLLPPHLFPQRGRASGEGAAPTNGNGAGAAAPTPAPRIVEGPSPVYMAKAVKNAAELAGMREAHLRDAVALCDFLCWLEREMEAGSAFRCARRRCMRGWTNK